MIGERKHPSKNVRPGGEFLDLLGSTTKGVYLAQRHLNYRPQGHQHNSVALSCSGALAEPGCVSP